MEYASKVIRKDFRRMVTGPVYEPLTNPTSIRLLELFPGQEADPIRCRLQITDSENTPDYEALSYAWGNPKDKEQIERSDGRVKIPINLHDLLRRIRDPVNIRRLWADAICIDQSDLEEVGHQVRQMASIYSCAKRVIIWLGSNDPLDSWCKEEQPAMIIRQCLEYSSQNYSASSSSLYEVQRTTSFDLTGTISAVSILFQQPWFDRLWVLQEAGLARSGLVMFGHREIDYDELIALALQLRYQHPELTHEYGFPGRLKLSSLFSKKYCDHNLWTAKKVDFLDLLELSRFQQASDPRDYIFALLGHPSAKIEGALLIEPNYRKSSLEIFHESTVKLIQQTQNLRVLSAVRHLGEQVFGREYPSWVPVWRRDSNSLGVHQFNFLYWDAHAGMPGIFCFANAYKTLREEGFAFDAIDDCTGMIVPPPGSFRLDHWPIADAMRFKKRLTMSTPDYLSELTTALTLRWRQLRKKLMVVVQMTSVEIVK